MKQLKSFGAKSIYVYATHGLFTNPAIDRLKLAPIDKIITTNTIPATPQEQELGSKINRLSVAPLLAEVIKRIEDKSSLSSLFIGGGDQKITPS